MADLDWLVPGTRVAVVGGRGGYEWVTFSTIDRVLKRDVVLDNGERFSKQSTYGDSLIRRRGTWDPSTHLYRADDEHVLRVYARAERRRVSHKVEDLMQEWRDTNEDDVAREALRVLQEALDEQA